MALQPFFGGTGLLDPMFPFGRGRDPLDFGNMLPSLAAVAPASASHPLDVVETNDAFKVTVDVPGMGADDLKISMDEGVMTISGQKAREHEEKREGRVLRRERAFTSFSRSFTLPDNVKGDEITANLHNGVLEVTVPKTAPPPKPEPKRIQVTTTGGSGEAPKITQK